MIKLNEDQMKKAQAMYIAQRKQTAKYAIILKKAKDAGIVATDDEIAEYLNTH